MADVTFGVKVNEEMKQELSDLMKENGLSGKEFMQVLLASYKLEKTRKSSNHFGEELKEVQRLLGRLQSVYIQLCDKGENLYQDAREDFEKLFHEKEQQVEAIRTQYGTLKEEMKGHIEEKEEAQKEQKALKKALEAVKKTLEEKELQFKNTQLLYTKYEEEVAHLKEKVESYKRLDIELKERHEALDKLTKRNDEQASEIWFLKREIEKLNIEKETTAQNYEAKIKQIKETQILNLKNERLELELGHAKIQETLKDEIGKLKQQVSVLKGELALLKKQ